MRFRDWSNTWGSEVDNAIDQTVDEMEAWKLPTALTDSGFNYKDVAKLVTKCAADISRDSSPGYPIKLDERMATNAQLLDNYGTELVMAATNRLVKMFNADENTRERWASDPMAALLDGVTGPISPFNKYEGHKPSKVAEGRWRVVCALDLVDQLVERVLFGNFKKSQELVYPRGPSMFGLGVSHDCNKVVAEEYLRVTKLLGVPYSGDIRQWDGSLSSQLLHVWPKVAIGTLRKKRGPGNDEHWCAAMGTWADLRVNPVYYYDGLLLVSNTLGRMPSGTMATTPANCVMRTVLARLVGALASKNLGDDCIEWFNGTKTVDEVVLSYRKIGLTLRDAEACGEREFAFCSHDYVENEDGVWLAKLQTVTKAAFKLLTAKPKAEALRGVLEAIDDHDDDVKLKVLCAYLAQNLPAATCSGQDDQ